MLSARSQLRWGWLHNTQCPEVRAVYKIVSTTENLVKYERYLSVSLIIVDSFRWLTHAPGTAIESKPGATSLHRTSPVETRNADGTGQRGSAELEMKE